MHILRNKNTSATKSYGCHGHDHFSGYMRKDSQKNNFSWLKQDTIIHETQQLARITEQVLEMKSILPSTYVLRFPDGRDLIYSVIYTNTLTHWGRVTHICLSKLTIIGSDNGLSPGRRQAIIWTCAGILLIGPLGTSLGEILIEIYTFSFTKMLLKMSSGKWQPSCLGPNVLTL